MHNVDPGIPGAELPQDSVQVRPIVVDKGVVGVRQLHDPLDMGIEDAERVGVRQHYRSGIVRNDLLQFRHVQHPRGRVSRRGAHAVSGKRGTGGVGPMRLVRNHDLGLVAAAVPMVRGYYHHPCQLAVSPGKRVQRECGHAEDLAHQRLELEYDLQRTLHQHPAVSELGQERVQINEPRQSGDGLEDLGVVLHRA